MSPPKPYYQRAGITIYNACWQDVPLQSGALIVTDPPYGTDGWRRLEAGAGSNPSGSLVREEWDDGAVDWLIAAEPSAVLTFWPPARTSCLLNAANTIGLTKHRALYMRKRDPKSMPRGRTCWSVEPVWVLSRDGFVLHGGTDWCEVSTPRLGRDSDATGHPYQKPLEAMLWLIAKTSGDLILDPFMGSGSTLAAAQMLGRRAIGIEIEERYCEIAAKRLAQDVLPLELPA